MLVTTAPTLSPAGTSPVQYLDVEQLAACRTTIEDIRWSHRIWPKENKTPKPAREEIISDQQIRSGVEDSLRMEAVLAGLYNIEITGAMLQAELNRMARNTRAPKRLQELFDALGNDPLLVGECLARPALVRKKLYNSYVRDNRFHGDLKALAEAALAAGGDSADLAASGGREELLEYVYVDNDTDPLSAAADAGDSPLQRIELSGDAFNRQISRLSQLSGSRPYGLPPGVPAPAVGQILRETETAFVFEQVQSRTEDRMQVRTLVWPKTGFSDWWQSESTNWQPADLSVAGLSTSAAPLVQPVIIGDGKDFEAMNQSEVTADTWAPLGMPAGR